jgi:hypothetical protein
VESVFGSLMQQGRTARTFLLSLVLIALSWPLFNGIASALGRSYWFELTNDESSIGEVIQNIASRGFYGNWHDTQFPAEITPGPMFMLPAAWLAKVSGLLAAESGRIVSFLYFAAFLAAIAGFTRCFLKARAEVSRIALIFFALGIFYQGWSGIQGNNYWLFGVFGESAAVFYLVLSLLFLHRSSWFWAGIFASLSLLSKPYMLYLPASVGLVVFVSDPLGKKGRLWPTVFGLALPIGLWQAYMIAQLGVEGWLAYWKAYPQALKSQTGLQSLEASSKSAIQLFFDKVIDRLSTAWSFLKIRSFVLALMGAVFLIRNFRKGVVFQVALVYTLIHFAWFFGMSTWVIPRYIFTSLTVLWIFAALWGVEFVTDGFERWLPSTGNKLLSRNSVLALIFPFLFVAGITGYRAVGEWKRSAASPDTCGFCQQRLMLHYWKELKNPPTVWSLGTEPGDIGFLFSNHYQLREWQVPELDRADLPPSGDWVLYGLFSDRRVLDLIKRRGCTPVFTVSKTWFGFWKCS